MMTDEQFKELYNKPVGTFKFDLRGYLLSKGPKYHFPKGSIERKKAFKYAKNNNIVITVEKHNERLLEQAYQYWILVFRQGIVLETGITTSQGTGHILTSSGVQNFILDRI